MSNKHWIIIAVLGVLLLPALGRAQSYDLPNDNTSCPANCRQVPWVAGFDIWNAGLPPTRTKVTCGGLAANGTTNDAPAIQTCLNNAAAGTSVSVPAGVYFVNSNITLKSNVTLTGAKAVGSEHFLPAADSAATTFKIGANGEISTPSGTRGTNQAITSGYTKGSQSIVMSTISHGFIVGDFILISENPDTAIPVSSTGDDGTCTWCGENDGVHLMVQIVQVTSVSGATIGINKPLYYTMQSTFSPVARKFTYQTTKAGLENIRLDGSSVDHGVFIWLSCAYCWVRGVETYMSGSGAQNKPYHLELDWSYGADIYGNFFHHSRDTSSDKGYGIAFLFSNSDHKVENNIVLLTRHGTDCEGGCSGIAFLYNYVDDGYESGATDYLGSARTNHGAHPYMNLYEGNVYSNLLADNIWGTSSHNVYFRNWLMGNEKANPDLPATPTFGFNPLKIVRNQNYYSVVGNILGTDVGTPVNAVTVDWSTYSLVTITCAQTGGAMYDYGCDSNGVFSATAKSTSINHGNYDYKTHAVAYWDGGSNHTLRSSMYYASKPSYFGSITWPPFGPEPTITAIPAQVLFASGGSGGGGGLTGVRKVGGGRTVKHKLQ